MVVHEAGHVLAAIRYGNDIQKIRFMPFGLKADITGQMYKREKIVIYLCGPLINIFLFSISILINSAFLKNQNNILIFFTYLNIYLSIFNLLPVLPLDGGRIAFEIISEKFGNFNAYKYICIVSVSVSTIFIIIGVILIADGIYNFCILLIGLYVFTQLKSGKREVTIMNMKDVIYRRSRLLKKGIYPARDLVVVKTMRMGEVLKSLDFDRFHIIHVLDEDLKLINVFTEQDIMDGVIKYNTDMTFEEFIMKNN
ncbi:MAG: site-2 protease family protein [Bacillota bacterium]|nr:site-2 protease family protein [Bacillota bacterium]